MNERRFTFGLITSTVWIAGVGWVAWTFREGFQTMRPNEWGDFLAGTFAPLAFFWLILGYLQQGEELRLSTKALLLQAEELKNSVEQQRELVEVSRLQVASEREALHHQEMVRRETTRPIFVISATGGAFRGDGHSTYNVQFSNGGADVTNFRAELDYGGASIKTLLNVAILNRGGQISTSFSLDQPFPEGSHCLKILYRSISGESSEIQYAVSRESPDPHSNLAITADTKSAA